MSSEVLVYTIHGMVPIDTLDYTQEWEDHIDVKVTLTSEAGNAFVPTIKKTGYMVFKEMYHDKVTNELVRQDCHICMLSVPEITETQQGFLQAESPPG